MLQNKKRGSALRPLFTHSLRGVAINLIAGIPTLPRTKDGGGAPATPILFSGNLYLFEPIINPILGMPILARTKGGTNFELIEVPLSKNLGLKPRLMPPARLRLGRRLLLY